MSSDDEEATERGTLMIWKRVGLFNAAIAVFWFACGLMNIEILGLNAQTAARLDLMQYASASNFHNLVFFGGCIAAANFALSTAYALLAFSAFRK